MLNILPEIYFSRVCVQSAQLSLLSMVLLEIVIECSPDDVGSPALNGLALVILDSQFDLENISETNWKHGGAVEMYVVNPPVIRLRTC